LGAQGPWKREPLVGSPRVGVELGTEHQKDSRTGRVWPRLSTEYGTDRQDLSIRTLLVIVGLTFVESSSWRVSMNAHCGSSARHRQFTQQLMHQMAGTRHLLSGPGKAWVWASVGWQTRGKDCSFAAFRCLGLHLLSVLSMRSSGCG
jgi:hypothetical protein